MRVWSEIFDHDSSIEYNSNPMKLILLWSIYLISAEVSYWIYALSYRDKYHLDLYLISWELIWWKKFYTEIYVRHIALSLVNGLESRKTYHYQMIGFHLMCLSGCRQLKITTCVINIWKYWKSVVGKGFPAFLSCPRFPMLI